MKQKFVEHTFRPEAIKIIEIANAILGEYQRQGFRLSLRQLYYQFVARGLRENTERSYKNLGNLISDARDAGLIDWNMIEDRGRDTVMPSHWLSPKSIIEAAAYSFRIDKWRDQPCHIECMVEKDALRGVLEPVCLSLDVSLTPNKGYGSSSLMYEIGRRLHDRIAAGKDVHIIYCGDHDPSGIDMTRDVLDRLSLYAEECRDIDVIRIALNYDQVQRWSPPPNPAKTTDSRCESYIKKFGTTSWELDAVRPNDLADLVRSTVMAYRDDALWQAALTKEQQWRDELNTFAASYNN